MIDPAISAVARGAYLINSGTTYADEAKIVAAWDAAIDFANARIDAPPISSADGPQQAAQNIE